MSLDILKHCIRGVSDFTGCGPRRCVLPAWSWMGSSESKYRRHEAVNDGFVEEEDLTGRKSYPPHSTPLNLLTELFSQEIKTNNLISVF
jgi:hypothetical protein